jgi:antitoxin CptB
MDHATRLKRLRFRAWHRGTKEADLMMGGYADHHGASWDEAELAWFEALLEEQDVDIMAWAMGTADAPARWQGPMLDRLRALDFVTVAD